MFTGHYVENYSVTWETSSTLRKQNLIINAFKKILRKYNINEESKTTKTEGYDNLTYKCVRLKNMLLSDDYSALSDQIKYSNLVACIANTLNDPMMVKTLKNTYVFPDGIITWNTTINNINLFNALMYFSNLCVARFVTLNESKQHQQIPSLGNSLRN